MSKSSAVHSLAPATENRLFAGLSKQDLDRISPYLESAELASGQLLYAPDARIEHVYFPTSGSVSVMLLSREGAVEVGSVGREGFVGVAALLHADSMPTRTFVQAQGDAYRMEVKAFRAVMSSSAAIERLFSRYTLAFMNQVAQAVACNRLHSLEARCARWLLMAHDRVDGNQLFLTHQSLSYMLGVHRPAITLAAGVLHKAGLIDYSRGKINITDRRGLEGASCICYQTLRDDFKSLIDTGVRPLSAAVLSATG